MQQCLYRICLFTNVCNLLFFLQVDCERHSSPFLKTFSMKTNRQNILHRDYMATVYIHVLPYWKVYEHMYACVYDGIFALFYAFSLLAFCNPKLHLLYSPHTKDKRITFQNVLLHSEGYKLVEMPLNDNGNFFISIASSILNCQISR